MTRRRPPVAPRPGHLGVEQRLLAAWRALDPSLPAGPIVVGFSGGADSLALLVALSHLARPIGRPIEALHVDHALRPSSADEAKVAVRLAEGVGVTCRVARIADGLVARHPGAGEEEAARRERYLAAAAVCAPIDAPFLTAHHADDQAETVLMHLVRGSGLTGLAGMRPVSTLVVPWWKPADDQELRRLVVVRPALGLSRADLADYLTVRAPELRPIVDPTNAEARHRRNDLRATVLPELDRIFPGAVMAIGRFAAIAAEDASELDEIADRELARLSRNSRHLDVAPLAALSVAIRRRVIAGWIRAMSGLAPTFDRVEAVIVLIGSAGGSAVEIGEGWSVGRRRGDLVLQRDGSESGQTSVG